MNNKVDSTLTHISDETRDILLCLQRNDHTQRLIYLELAERTNNHDNAPILEEIAESQQARERMWQQYTGQEVRPDRFRMRRYLAVARLLGLTFTVRLLERREAQNQDLYARVANEIPEAQRMVESKSDQKHRLIDQVDEERLEYVGSMVLGLNDALVELTGALAGLTLALRDTSLIGASGLITGIAASMSMAASQYLSVQAEENEQSPLKASAYTGASYVFAVVLLVLPYWLVAHYLTALGVTLTIAVLIILAFTYYLSVARDLPFRHRFLQMAGISLGVAALSFVVGFAVRELFGLEV
jgi:vacuolar iron transporter family protein